MKYLLLTLVLVLTVGEAQQQQRDKAEELLERAYRSAAVRDLCIEYPKEIIDVMVDGFLVPVDCAIWHRWRVSQKQ